MPEVKCVMSTLERVTRFSCVGVRRFDSVPSLRALTPLELHVAVRQVAVCYNVHLRQRSRSTREETQAARIRMTH